MTTKMDWIKKRGKIKRTCITCSGNFCRRPSEIKEYGGKFCSTNCSTKHWNRIRREARLAGKPANEVLTQAKNTLTL